ncbi:MAG: hypothetical protein VR77_10705 [Flavobacteriales bacterium BRH_c54]|nr:MAG: hypothetical protein VR77_10705 [Flavobacteriales bacterium BRH_c54]
MGIALDKFKESLELAISLRKIETDKYARNRQVDQPFKMGLRGGSAVLMVASFELYLRRLFEENIARLNTSPPSIDLIKLPENLKIKIVFDGLNTPMKAPKYGPTTQKVDRIDSVLTACKHLIGEHINPSTFSETNSNPNSDTVKTKFKEVGIANIFVVIKTDFETKWGSVVAATFIEDKLNEIVNVRHVVAHTADTLNITKASQKEAIKFLKILSELLDKELDKHIKHLLVTARK